MDRWPRAPRRWCTSPAWAAPATSRTLFRINVRGLFDAFEAARLAGIRRIVFASSNHAFGCYPIDVPVSPDMPPRPD